MEELRMERGEIGVQEADSRAVHGPFEMGWGERGMKMYGEGDMGKGRVGEREGEGEGGIGLEKEDGKEMEGEEEERRGDSREGGRKEEGKCER